MPTANELIAHGREVDEIRQIIGADGLIFQDLNDLIDAVRAENPDIQQFECSVFNGVYVTRDVDQQYLDYLDSCVTMMPKRSSCRTKSKTSRCTTRGKSSIAASGVPSLALLNGVRHQNECRISVPYSSASFGRR